MGENLVMKLLKAQKELKAPKGNFNSFGKYKYRSAEDILEAVKPLNAEHGLLLTLTDEPVYIGEWHYIKATATITDGEQTHSVSAYARESLQKKGMDDSQITGTASSYARKYALNGLYLIDDTKDADTDEYQKQSKPKENELNNEITTKFSAALQAAGGKDNLYKQLSTNKSAMEKLLNSKNEKAKKEMIQKLEGVINDTRNAG